MLPEGFKKEIFDENELFINAKRRLAIFKKEDDKYELCCFTKGKGKEQGTCEYKSIFVGSYKEVLEYMFKNY